MKVSFSKVFPILCTVAVCALYSYLNANIAGTYAMLALLAICLLAWAVYALGRKLRGEEPGKAGTSDACADKSAGTKQGKDSLGIRERPAGLLDIYKMSFSSLREIVEIARSK